MEQLEQTQQNLHGQTIEELGNRGIILKCRLLKCSKHWPDSSPYCSTQSSATKNLVSTVQTVYLQVPYTFYYDSVKSLVLEMKQSAVVNTSN